MMPINWTIFENGNMWKTDIRTKKEAEFIAKQMQRYGIITSYQLKKISYDEYNRMLLSDR